MNQTIINNLKKRIGAMFLHRQNVQLIQNAIDSLFWDIQNRDKQIIQLNQDRERYVGLFKFFNNIQIIMKDGQTHYFDGDYNKFHQFISINLFDIQSITIKEKEQ